MACKSFYLFLTDFLNVNLNKQKLLNTNLCNVASKKVTKKYQDCKCDNDKRFETFIANKCNKQTKIIA